MFLLYEKEAEYGRFREGSMLAPAVNLFSNGFCFDVWDNLDCLTYIEKLIFQKDHVPIGCNKVEYGRFREDSMLAPAVKLVFNLFWHFVQFAKTA